MAEEARDTGDEAGASREREHARQLDILRRAAQGEPVTDAELADLIEVVGTPPRRAGTSNVASAQIAVIMGSHHQGEGSGGERPRLHWLMANGVVACGAVPRSKGNARLMTWQQFVDTAVSDPPTCPACRNVLQSTTPRKRDV